MSQRIPYPTPVNLHLFDLPGDSKKREGFWAAPENLDPNAPWRGVNLWQSPRPRSGFRLWGKLTDQATTGTCLSVLRPRYFRQGELDSGSILAVQVPESFAPFETVSEADLRAGRNTFLIGSEVVQVRRWELDRVTPQLERVFLGFGIRRGLLGTGRNGRGHTRGERVVWMDHGGVEYIHTPATLLPGERFWRAVPPGGTLSDAETVTVQRIPRHAHRLTRGVSVALDAVLRGW